MKPKTDQKALNETFGGVCGGIGVADDLSASRLSGPDNREASSQSGLEQATAEALVG